MILLATNLFSDGLNLDTHAIAINNKSLSGALNGTMITMNGNELVLQTDMGNGRVEEAHLPQGYVPVGMTEFGGIIYVASHNPLTGESQIGSFPSPERNISTDEVSNKELSFYRFSSKADANYQSYIDENSLIITSISQKLGIKVDNPIRPGDKFSIEMNSIGEDFINLLKLLKNNEATLDVCTMNADGALVAIDTTLLIEPYEYAIDGKICKSIVYNSNYTNEERRYNVYKNKIVGDLYLRLTLNIPNDIIYYLLADSDNGKSKYTIYFPKVDNISKYRLQIIKTNSGKIPDSSTELLNIDINMLNDDEVLTDSITAKWATLDKINELLAYQGLLNATLFKMVTIEWEDTAENRIEVCDGVEYDVIHTYTIVPYLLSSLEETYGEYNSGYIINLTLVNEINLNKLGRGIIDFTGFKYYNNTQDNMFTILYSMETYLQSALFILSVDLCTIDYNDLLNDNGVLDFTKSTVFKNESTSEEDKVFHTIPIGTSLMSYFGTFQSTLEYTNTGTTEEEHSLDKGKVYIAFIRTTISNIDNNISYKYSKPFLLLTSSFANYLFSSNLKSFIDAAEGNNPADVDLENNVVWDDYLGIPCSIDWKYLTADNTVSTVITNSPTILSANSKESEFNYKELKTGSVSYKLNPIVTLLLGNDFPFQESDVDAKISNISYAASTKSKNPVLVGNADQNNIDSSLKNSIVDLECECEFDEKTNTLSYNVELSSQFYATSLSVENETKSGAAFVPYLNDLCRNQILLQNLYQSDDLEYHESAVWFSMTTVKSSIGNHSRRSIYFIDTYKAPNSGYTTVINDTNTPYIPTGADGVTEVYTIKSTDADWSEYSNAFRDEYIANYKLTPLIAFALPKLDSNHQSYVRWNNDSTYDACIPMLLDTKGVYHPLELLGKAISYKNNIGLVDTLLSHMNNDVFILQDDLLYTVSYKYANPKNYVYSPIYTEDVTVILLGTTQVSLGDKFPEDAIISMIIEDNKVTVTPVHPLSKNYESLATLLKSKDYLNVKAVKIPKVTLIDTSGNIKAVDIKEITFSISSPDIEDRVALYIGNVEDYANPAISNDVIIRTDYKGKALNNMYAYFLKDNLLYSSEDIISDNLIDDFKDYQSLINALHDGVLVIEKHDEFNLATGLYVNYTKAKTLPKYTSNFNTIGDDIGELRYRLVSRGQGIKVLL